MAVLSIRSVSASIYSIFLSFFVYESCQSLLLVIEDGLLVLVETDKIEMQIFDSILIKQVLSQQASQVNICCFTQTRSDCIYMVI